MKKTWIWLFVVIFALSGVLAACSKPAETTTPPAEATEAPVVATEAPKTTAAVVTPAPEIVAEVTESETVEDVTYSRSPYLEGKGLPPIEECLPKVPKLANETKAEFFEGGEMAIGKFGGTLRMSFTSTNWHPDIFMGCNEAFMFSPSILGESVHCNIMETVEVNDAQTEFTFKMREGLKWSDGEPVTIDDVKFAIEDCMFNLELNTAGPGKVYRDGNSISGDPMAVEWVDDWTFTLKFKVPNGHFLLLQAFNGWVGYTDMLKPAHYLKQWHKTYGDMAEMKAEAERLSVNWNADEDWVNLFNTKDVTNWEMCQEQAQDMPRLYPWLLTNFDAAGKGTYVRNPYYFKVDKSGQQLPYVDEIEFTYFADQELYTLSIISGEQDFVRESATMSKIALYKENESNGFTAVMLKQHVDQILLRINLTYGIDKAEGTVENDFYQMSKTVDFRRAVTNAINGPEIIDTIYYGYADPAFITPDNNDLDGAKTRLDGLGMDKTDADGWRLYPDGKQFQAYLEYNPKTSAEWSDVSDLICQNIQRAGLKLEAKGVDGSLLDQRSKANELQFTIGWHHIPLYPSGCYVDFQGAFGRLYDVWFANNGEGDYEPEQWMKDAIQELANLNTAGVGSEECINAYYNMIKILGDNYCYTQIGSSFRQPMIVNSDLRNIPNDGFAIACNQSMECLYYENPDQHNY